VHAAVRMEAVRKDVWTFLIRLSLPLRRLGERHGAEDLAVHGVLDFLPLG